MLSFAAAIFFLIITPGAGVLSTAGVAAGYGARVALGYVLGLFIGNNLVVILVISGVAAAALAHPVVGPVLLFASAAYLLYLAFRIGWAGSRVAFIERASAPGIGAGVVLQFINPKAYAVNTALFSGFHFLAAEPVLEIAVKLAILNAIWIPIHLAWLYAGLTLKRLDLSETAHSRINKLMALSLTIVVVLSVLSGLTQTS